MKKLAVLICSLVERKPLLDRLVDMLQPQMNDDIEVLSNIDNREKTVGQKRNELLARSDAQFICFVDDDDTVVPDYIPKILTGLESNPDCCGIEGVFRSDGNERGIMVHSLSVKGYYTEGSMFFRTPNHLNPVRRSIALNVGFREMNACEDGDYACRIFPHLKRESYISGPIYIYNYSHLGSQTNIQPPQIAYRNTFGGDFKFFFKANASPSGQGIRIEFDGKAIHLAARGKLNVSEYLQANVSSRVLVSRAWYGILVQRNNHSVIVDVNGTRMVEFKYEKRALPISIKAHDVQIQMLHIGGAQIQDPSVKFARRQHARH